MERWKAKKNRLDRWSLDLKLLGALEHYTKNRWSVEQRYVLERWSAERKRGGALERYEKRAGALECCYPWTGPIKRKNPSTQLSTSHVKKISGLMDMRRSESP